MKKKIITEGVDYNVLFNAKYKKKKKNTCVEKKITKKGNRWLRFKKCDVNYDNHGCNRIKFEVLES